MIKLSKCSKPTPFVHFLCFIVISKVPPTVQRAYVDRRLHYGRLYFLHCYARSGRDYIYPGRFGWFKDGKRMKIASSSRTMNIGLMQYQDTGIYTCIMENSVGSVNVTYNVTVYGKRFYVYILIWLLRKGVFSFFHRRGRKI